MSHIKIVGYYGHGNIGDEQYKYTFRYIFDCDNIENFNFNESDIICLIVYI